MTLCHKLPQLINFIKFYNTIVMDEEMRNFFKLSTDAVFEVFGSGQCHLVTEKHMPSALRSGLIYHIVKSVYSCKGKSGTSESGIM